MLINDGQNGCIDVLVSVILNKPVLDKMTCYLDSYAARYNRVVYWEIAIMQIRKITVLATAKKNKMKKDALNCDIKNIEKEELENGKEEEQRGI